MPKNELKVAKFPQCDMCSGIARYDGRTVMGPWAYMCEKCFNIYGFGLGLGKGQKFVLKEEGGVDNDEETG